MMSPRSFLCSTLLLMTAGCMPSLESGEPPERIYWLEPANVESELAVDVHVAVVPGLNSDHIWLLERDQRLNYYAGAFWADSLGPLLESVLDRSLNRAGSVKSAVVVDVLIERFFAVEAGNDVVPDVELSARLSGRAGEEIICSLARTRTARSGRLRDIVAAHQALVDELAGAVGRFADALRQGELACTDLSG
jgi:ABC-type uncharacterized transport system auxiliary subunit